MSFRLFAASRNHSARRPVRSNQRSANRRQDSRRLLLEPLENRALLAVFNPLCDAEDGAADSLRAAIIAANRNGQDDSINLEAGFYDLTVVNVALRQENAAATGDLDLTDANHTLTIQGQGASTIVDARHIDRVFQVASNVTVVFSNLVIRNGAGNDDGTVGATSQSTDFLRGGAILSAVGSNVTLNNVLLEQSALVGGDRSPAVGSTSQGGGIYAAGNLTLNRTVISGNTAQGGYRSSGGSDGQGGGIFSAATGSVILNGSSVVANQVQGAQGSSGLGGAGRGGGIFAAGPITLANTKVVANRALGGTSFLSLESGMAQGAGLFADGTVSASNARIARNTALGGQGGIGGRGGTAQGGGCFATANSSLTFTATTFDGNRADGGLGGAVRFFDEEGGYVVAGNGGLAQGGGFALYGVANLAGTTLSNNSAVGAAGGAGGGAGGEAQGGGIWTMSGSSLTLSDVTITGNDATGNAGSRGFGRFHTPIPGGLGGDGMGGGLYMAAIAGVPSTVSGVNVTVANNATRGGAGGEGQGIDEGRPGGQGGAVLGGGVYAGAGSSLSLARSTIVNCLAIGGAGGRGGEGSGGYGGAGGTATGGGVHVAEATASLTNCTVSGNGVFAADGGRGGDGLNYNSGNGNDGGPAGDGRGGGIFVFNNGSVLALNNCTIAANGATGASGGSGGTGGNGAPNGLEGSTSLGEGGGVYVVGKLAFNGGRVNAASTIVGDNTAARESNYLGQFNSATNNLVESWSGLEGIADGVNGNIVGKDAKLGPLASNGGPTKTHLLLAASLAIDHGANPAGLATDQRGLPRASYAVDIGAVELQAPRVVLGGTATYVENASALVLAASATVSDADSANFNGGKLTVTITVNSNAADRLEIKHQGTGAGQVGVSGSTVTYGGVTIGAFAGGTGSTPLVITFNTAAATSAAAQALARVITFRTVTDNPSTTARTITFVVNDGDGRSSSASTATKTVNVTAVNDAPVLAGGGSTGYALNTAPLVLMSTATVADPDSTNFSGGRFTVHYTAGAGAGNSLGLSGSFTVDGSSNVKFGDVIIGTRTQSGVGTSDLVITFNANATVWIVQQLLRSVTFKAASSTAQRVLAFTVTDGDGGVSNPITKTINVTA